MTDTAAAWAPPHSARHFSAGNKKPAEAGFY